MHRRADHDHQNPLNPVVTHPAGITINETQLINHGRPCINDNKRCQHLSMATDIQPLWGTANKQDTSCLKGFDLDGDQ